jgi:cation:H+ antiporter
MTAPLLGFLASAAAIVAAGSVLSIAADAIAGHSGIGRIWIGTVLLAGATSLPELFTDVSAVRLGAPNLAAGDLFGSSLANMLILALIDLLPGRERVLRSASLDNALGATLAIILNAAAAVLVVVRQPFKIAGIGPGSLVLLAIYLAGTRAIYRSGRRNKADAPAAEKSTPPARSLRRAIVEFAAGAIVIAVAAPALASSAQQVAVATGLGTTFVGTWMLGLVTSLPELVTSLAAVRIGAFDMAVGNLFGSNSFNMVVFLALDLASPGVSIFSRLDPIHVFSACLSVVLMSLGLATIVYRTERRFSMLEPSSALMLLAYAAAIVALYLHAGGRF